MEEKRNYPKGIFARAGKLYLTVYDPVKKRSRQISTGLDDTKSNIKSARDILDQVKQEIKSAKEFVPSKDQMLFSALLDLYKSHHLNKEKLHATLESASRHFMEATGDFPIREYNKSDVVKFISYLRQNPRKYSRNTIAQYNNSIKTVFSFAVREELIEKTPFKSMAFEEKEILTIPDEDLEKIFSFLRSKPKYRTTYFALRFLYLTGLRTGELLKLRWSDLDLENNALRVTNTKADRYDYLPMSGELVHLCNEMEVMKQAGTKADRYIFRTHFTQPGLIAKFKHAQVRIFPGEKKQYTLHNFRKTFISRLVNSGLSPFFVLSLARHTNIKTTLKYYVKMDAVKIREKLNEIRF